MLVQHDARGEGVVEVGWIDPSVGKPQRAKIGVTDSRGAVPTKDERRTDRLSMMDWLTKAPGDSASVAAGAGPDASCYRERRDTGRAI